MTATAIPTGRQHCSGRHWPCRSRMGSWFSAPGNRSSISNAMFAGANAWSWWRWLEIEDVDAHCCYHRRRLFILACKIVIELWIDCSPPRAHGESRSRPRPPGANVSHYFALVSIGPLSADVIRPSISSSHQHAAGVVSAQSPILIKFSSGSHLGTFQES